MFQMENINPVSFWYSDIPVCQLGIFFFFFLNPVYCNYFILQF